MQALAELCLSGAAVIGFSLWMLVRALALLLVAFGLGVLQVGGMRLGFLRRAVRERILLSVADLVIQVDDKVLLLNSQVAAARPGQRWLHIRPSARRRYIRAQQRVGEDLSDVRPLARVLRQQLPDQLVQLGGVESMNITDLRLNNGMDELLFNLRL